MYFLISNDDYRDSCLPSFNSLVPSHGFFRYRVVRYLCGVDIDDLTRRVTKQLPRLLAHQQQNLVNRFKYLLETEWQVKNAAMYQEIIENNLYNQHLTFVNFPAEIFSHLISYLNVQELVKLRVCKKLVDPILCQSLIHDFSLKKLFICPSIQIIDILKYLDCFGELIKGLDLSTFKYQLNDDQLDNIFKKCTKITYLNLENQKHFSSLTLENLIHLTSLKTLNLNRCCPLINESLISLTSLENLESIHLAGCCKITDQAIKNLQSSTNLRSIYLNWTKITDNGLHYLPKFINLKELYLAGNSGITDQGLLIIKCLVQLTRLDLSYSHQISDQGVNSLKSLIHLKWLNLAFNPQLTQKSLELLPFLPQLEEVNITGWSTLSKQAIKEAESLNGSLLKVTR
jgi:hypothetical protein